MGSKHNLLSPFYYKTGTMGRIGSTSYVLPIQLVYCTLNRVIRVNIIVVFFLNHFQKKFQLLADPDVVIFFLKCT